MENWGLVTYRESALLTSASSAASDRQRVTVVVAHELAHFWFGDYVTSECGGRGDFLHYSCTCSQPSIRVICSPLPLVPLLLAVAWWSSLFLNEGFATKVCSTYHSLADYSHYSHTHTHSSLSRPPTHIYRHTLTNLPLPSHIYLPHQMEFVGTDAVHPEFGISRQFQSADIFVAMRATAYGDSRSLVTEVDSSAAIESQFDGVAYSYGGSLLYMIEDFVERVKPGSYCECGEGRFMNEMARIKCRR